jgi:hypothetical protein
MRLSPTVTQVQVLANLVDRDRFRDLSEAREPA